MRKKETKPFFYRLNAVDLFSKIHNKNDKEVANFARKFATDLIIGFSDDEFTQSMIDEAQNYIKNKVKAGKESANRRWNKEADPLTEV